MTKPSSAKTFSWVADQLSELLGTDPTTVKADMTLIDDIGADSIDVVEMITAAERDFGIVVEEEQIYNIATVGDAVELIDRLRAESE